MNGLRTERLNRETPIPGMERMHLESADKEALRHLGRRFLWMTLALYAALTLGLWIAHAVAPATLGLGDYDYVVSVSLLGAVAFGGLYAAAMALRPGKPGKAVPPEAD